MDKLNSWLTLGANIGILAGLLLLAFQINQATEISLVERRSESFVASMDTAAMRASEELPERMARIMMNSKEITDADLVALDGYLTREFTLALRERAMSELGYAIGTVSPATVNKWVFANLGNESALRWWKHNEDTTLAMVPELRDQVNARLIELGPVHTVAHQRRLAEMRGGPIFGQTNQ